MKNFADAFAAYMIEYEEMLQLQRKVAEEEREAITREMELRARLSGRCAFIRGSMVSPSTNRFGMPSQSRMTSFSLL